MRALLGLVLLVCCGLAHGWDYKTGGGNWPGTCQRSFQSPVNINVPDVGGADSKKLEAYYPVVNAWEAGLKVVHTGSVIRVAAIDNNLGYVFFMGHKYFVRNIDFHAPAEHMIRGHKYDMEVQIVHQQDGAVGDDKVFIISAVYRAKAIPRGKASKFLKDVLFWNTLPVGKGRYTMLTEHFQLGSMLDGLHNGYFQYRGSMTQPPCERGVIWNVLETVQEITPAQVISINRLFKGNFSFAKGRGNNRAVQGIDDRTVTLHNHKPKGDGDNHPLPCVRTPETKAHRPQDTNAAAPEDLPAQNTSSILPRPATLPQIYADHGNSWSGLCKTGRTQSPIDIKPHNCGNPHGDYEFKHKYIPANVSVNNNGMAIELHGDFGKLNVVTDTTKETYTAKQLIFHTPAEHTVDGRRAAMELEIVHERGSLNTLRTVIVSVLFHESLSEPSDFLDSLSWHTLPPTKGAYVTLPVKVNLNLLKGLNSGYYSYAGSLSRPPCRESVIRFVMRTYNDASKFQVDSLRAIFNGNYRAIQKSNDRGVHVQNVNDAIDALPMFRNQKDLVLS